MNDSDMVKVVLDGSDIYPKEGESDDAYVKRILYRREARRAAMSDKEKQEIHSFLTACPEVANRLGLD